MSACRQAQGLAASHHAHKNRAGQAASIRFAGYHLSVTNAQGYALADVLVPTEHHKWTAIVMLALYGINVANDEETWCHLSSHQSLGLLEADRLYAQEIFDQVLRPCFIIYSLPHRSWIWRGSILQ